MHSCPGYGWRPPLLCMCQCSVEGTCFVFWASLIFSCGLVYQLRFDPSSLNPDICHVGYIVEGHGQRARLCCCLISDSIFWLFYFTPRWLVGVTPCPRKPQRNYTKEKTATDKRQRHFFYTFLYLLCSTTIPWMREFFLNSLKWLNPPVKTSKIR